MLALFSGRLDGMPTGDLAEYLNNGFRTWHGDMPYRDFWLLFPPGEVWWPASILSVTNGNLNALLRLNCLLSAGTAGLFFALTRKLSGRIDWALLVAISVFVNGSLAHKAGGWGYGHFYLLAPAAALLLLHRGLAQGRNRLFLAAGCMLGVGLMFRLFLVGAAWTAFLVALTLTAVERHSMRGSLARQALMLCLGPIVALASMAAILGPVALPAAKAISIDAVTHSTVQRGEEFMLVQRPTRAIGKLSTPGNSRSANETRRQAVDEIVHLLLLFLVPVAWMTLRLREGDLANRTAVDALVLWSLFSAVRIIARADLPHLTQTTAPLLIACTAALATALRTCRGKRGIQVLALFFLVLACRPLVDVAGDLLTAPSRIAVSTERGRFTLASEAGAAKVRQLLHIIESSSRPGEPIFVTAWSAPPLYAWTNRSNPTRFDSMIKFVFGHEQDMDTFCRALVNASPRVVIHQPQLQFGDQLDLKSRAPGLLACLDENFVRKAIIGQLEILAPSEYRGGSSSRQDHQPSGP